MRTFFIHHALLGPKVALPFKIFDKKVVLTHESSIFRETTKASSILHAGPGLSCFAIIYSRRMKPLDIIIKVLSIKILLPCHK